METIIALYLLASFAILAVWAALIYLVVPVLNRWVMYRHIKNLDRYEAEMLNDSE